MLIAQRKAAALLRGFPPKQVHVCVGMYGRDLPAIELCLAAGYQRTTHCLCSNLLLTKHFSSSWLDNTSYTPHTNSGTHK